MKTLKLLTILCLSVFSTLLMAEAKVVFSIEAEYQDVKGAEWKKISGGMTLQNYNIVRTQDRGRLILSTGGHTLRLAPNSQLELTSVTTDVNLNLSQGKLWAKVQALKGGSRFVVSSPTSMVGVRGTEFIVEHLDNITKLLVMEGKVAFGADLEKLFKLIEAGGYAEFRNGNVDGKKSDRNLQNQMKRGFPDFISMKSARDRFYRQRYDSRRNYFKNQISREMSQIQRNRDYIQTKIGNDVAAQRVVTDMAGNVTQIMQVMRKTDDNKLVLYNITSQKNFINVLQYTGTFENAVPNSLDKLKAMTDNKELIKDLYIVQREGSAAIDLIRIVEDKQTAEETQTITVGNSTTSNTYETDFPKLKQEEGNDYLSATFKKDGTEDIMLELKVYVLDRDGNVLSDPDVSGGLDFLMTGSVQFVFTKGVNETVTFNSGDRGVRFNTMPDVGFIVWLRD